MLNESFLLLKALERAGLALSREHSRVTPPGRSTGRCLRVRLDKEGGVTSVETVIENEWPGLWTVMEGNHNSFPVVRVKERLIDVTQDTPIWSELRVND